MFGVETLNGWAQAAVVMGIVLVEAIVLYVGYGALEHVFGHRITDAIRRD